MGFMADIPHFYCYVRAEYLYNLQEHHGEHIPCCVFAVDSVEGHAIGFDIMTDFGAQFARLPITALVHRIQAPVLPLGELELWNNFSYSIEAHEYGYLRHLRCDVWSVASKAWYRGTYMFTLSWFGSRYAEDSGAGGFKRAHVIKLDNGCFAAQPNNRVRWHEPSFITAAFPERPDFLTNEHIWNAETDQAWRTEHSDMYFYTVHKEE